ncbi:glycosyltransferase [Polynucleobacter paneuropaeus]|nr:glycosyltransferase [Polynucleobacter paneuropaeus]
MNIYYLSISIVVYKSDLDLLESLICSIKKALLILTSAINVIANIDIVNNCQNDPSLNMLINLVNKYPDLNLQLIQSRVNRGYGAGNNISIFKNQKSDFHLVLNPDIILHQSSLLNGINFLLSNTHIGLLTPCVLDMDTNKLQFLCKRNPDLLDMVTRSIGLSSFFGERFRSYEMRECDYSNIIEPVPYPTGCFMLFKTPVLLRAGGFDEGYFLHFEDADIGRSVGRISRTAYVPEVIVWHKWARETHKSWYIRLVTIKSGIRYLIKWRNK